MQKRYIPITVFTVLMAVIAFAGYLVSAPAQKMPERILLDNAGGKVVFDHQRHATEAKISCQTCHHESPAPREDIQRCGTCHGVTFDQQFRTTHAEAIKDKASCATCHHVEFAPKVAWNHKAHAEEYGVDCRSCHHEDKAIEPEPQNCATCHERKGDKDMPSLRDGVHAKCRSCHADMFDQGIKGCAQCHTKVESRERLAKQGPQVFAVTPFYADCATCHESKKAQELVPDRMSAFHGQCIKCHQTNGKGPFSKEQCNQCHTK